MSFLVALALLIFLIGLMLKPIPQPQSYHNFADQRSWLELPNALNVLSNVAFALAGIWGLFLLFSPGRIKFFDYRERWPWIGVAFGLILTAVGSGYYHLAPDNTHLVWDRLPMAIVFMSYVAALISERVNIRLGLWLWPILLGIGIYSVLLWHVTELRGIGDLRLYLGIQVFTILSALVMLMAKSPYNRNWDLAVISLLYVLAIVFEMLDHQIYLLSREIISGHTLKHLTAASAGVWLMLMIDKRKIIKGYIKDEN